MLVHDPRSRMPHASAAALAHVWEVFRVFADEWNGGEFTPDDLRALATIERELARTPTLRADDVEFRIVKSGVADVESVSMATHVVEVLDCNGYRVPVAIAVGEEAAAAALEDIKAKIRAGNIDGERPLAASVHDMTRPHADTAYNVLHDAAALVHAVEPHLDGESAHCECCGARRFNDLREAKGLQTLQAARGRLIKAIAELGGPAEDVSIRELDAWLEDRGPGDSDR